MIYAFADFEFDPGSFELRRQGRPVRIDRKTFTLLAYLIEHRDRVVPKQELFDVLWADEAVVESVLPTQIGRLRRALGQSGTDPSPIATAHRLGYRFVSPVEIWSRGQVSATSGPLGPSVPDTLIGREAALAQVGRALERIPSGSGQICLVCGDAGIGKSCLAQAASSGAAGAGLAVWQGAFRPGQVVAPFSGWAQVLRACRESGGDAARVRLPEHLRAQLGRLLPELLDDARASDAEPRLAPEARSELFEAVCGWLEGAAGEAGALVVLEDLHWADLPSLELLEFLAGSLSRSRVGVLATIRDYELAGAIAPAAQACLERLARSDGYLRIALEGFDLEETGTFADAMMRRPVPRSLVRSLHVRTAGNPFFLREMLAWLGDADRSRGVTGREEELPVLPEVVRDVLRSRLHGLADRPLRLLDIAAVLGPEFDLALLCEVSGWSGGAVFDALDETVARRLVRPLEKGLGQYAFGHELIRETILADLPAAARADLDLRVGRALERRCLAREVSPARVADHLLRALPLGDPQTAIAYATRAAQSADRVGAFGEAARLYARSLAALGFVRDATPAQRAQLMILHARATAEAGAVGEAIEAFTRVAELAREADLPERFAQATLGRLLCGGPLSPRSQELLGDLDAAIESAPDDQPGLKASLLARLSRTPFVAKQGRQLELAERAVELARAGGGQRSRLEALEAKAHALIAPDRQQDRRAATDEMLRIAGPGTTMFKLRAHQVRLEIDLGLADRHAADEDLRAIEMLALAEPHPVVQWEARRLRGQARLERGDATGSERYFAWLARTLRDDALGAGETRRAVELIETLLRVRVALAGGEVPEPAQIGRLEALAPFFGRSVRVPWARVLRADGRIDEAVRLIEEIVAPGLRSQLEARHGLALVWGVADLALLLGLEAIRDEACELLLPYADRIAVDRISFPLGSVAHVLGRAERARGRRASARAHLEHALALETEMELHVAVARTRAAIERV